MGAWFSETTGVGKTMDEAFRRVQDSARWENGHGGYSGTMAEKHEAVEIALPKRMSAKRFVALVVDGMEHLHDWDDAEQRKANERFWNRVPNAAVDAVRRAAELGNEKWGPAVAVELHGEAWSEAKKRHGVEKQRGVRAWIFFGYCSS